MNRQDVLAQDLDRALGAGEGGCRDEMKGLLFAVLFHGEPDGRRAGDLVRAFLRVEVGHLLGGIVKDAMLDRNECLLEHLGAVQRVSLDVHLEARLVGVDLEAGHFFRRQLNQISQVPVAGDRHRQGRRIAHPEPVLAGLCLDNEGSDQALEGLRPSRLGERPDIERDRLCTEVLRYGLSTATKKGTRRRSCPCHVGIPLAGRPACT